MYRYNKAEHHIPDNYRMTSFLDSINVRLDIIAKRIKTNEFSGKNINSIKSIILQIAQNGILTLLSKKLICLDILIAVEEATK